MASLLALSVPSLPNAVNRAGYTVETGHNHRHLDEASNPYWCTEGVKTAAEDWKVQGPNLGGWLVLEPWITPSLFYQFLSEQYDVVSWDDAWGKEAAWHTGMDQYTFCHALGPVEGNRQLRQHWKTWLREEDVAAIAATGATHVRIPVGDWMYKPYGPYIGCTDGAMEELERGLALCAKYGLGALLDLHAVRGSQNGFDNSGHGLDVKWGSEDQLVGFEMTTITTFEHWTIRAAHWMGKYNHETESYPVINHTNIDFTLSVVSEMVAKHKNNPAVWALEPVNEPWQFTPLDELKAFYWKAYWIVRKGAPTWRFVMHDSFRGFPQAWMGFMKGCPMKAMDTHVYQAWNRPGRIGAYWAQACNFKWGVRAFEEQVDMPFIVGEWSLATDNCAMWLNGFNDNLPGFPKVTCEMKPCAEPYMGKQPGAPPNSELPLQGPYGTGVSGPQFGLCPVGFEWGSNEDKYIKALTHKLLTAYTAGHGWFFWNFRTELEPRWSFLDAYKRGYFPKDVSVFTQADAEAACPKAPDAEAWAKPDAASLRPLSRDRANPAISTLARTPAGAAEQKMAAAPGLAGAGLLAFALLASLLVLAYVRAHSSMPAGEPDAYHAVEVPK